MSNVWVGAVSRIMFAREDPAAAYGTISAAFGGAGGSVTPRFLGITSQNVDLPDKTLEVKQYHSKGTLRGHYHKQVPGKRTRGSTIPVIPTTGELFYYLFGSETYTPGPPDNHVMEPAHAAVLPPMDLVGILEGAPNFQRIFPGTLIDGMSATLNEASELSTSIDVVAKTVTGYDAEPATGALPAQPTTDDHLPVPTPYMFYDTDANITISATGREWGQVKGFTWNYRNNLKPLFFKTPGGQDVSCYITSNPTFDLSIDLVPASQSAGNDAVYDLLESEVPFDVTIPFVRDTGDDLTFIFEDCYIKTAPHSIPEDGGEVVSNVAMSPTTMRVESNDSVGDAYANL